MTTPSESTVTEMRLVVTTDDYEQALGFYRDVLGLREIGAFPSPGGRVTLLDAGRATPELTDEINAQFVDEVEVGRWVAGHIRVGFEVPDAEIMTPRVAAAGAAVVAGPTPTPWGSLNARLEAPAGPNYPCSRLLSRTPDEAGRWPPGMPGDPRPPMAFQTRAATPLLATAIWQAASGARRFRASYALAARPRRSSR